MQPFSLRFLNDTLFKVRALVSVFFLALWASGVLANDTEDGRPWDHELCEQGLQEGRRRVVAGDFITERSLETYQAQLQLSDQQVFDFAKSGGHWIDMGAGNGYCHFGVMVRHMPELHSYRLTSVGLKPNRPSALESIQRWVKRSQGRFSYLFGYVEVQDSEELETRGINHKARTPVLPKSSTIDWTRVEKAHLITDLLGPLSYSPRPDLVMQRYLDLLAPGGRILIFASCGSLRVVSGRRVLDMVGWLESIPGSSVRVLFRGPSKAISPNEDLAPFFPLKDVYGVSYAPSLCLIQIEKAPGVSDIQVPRLTSPRGGLVDFIPAAPPLRTYLL